MNALHEQLFGSEGASREASEAANTLLESLLESEAFSDVSVETIERLAESLLTALTSGSVGESTNVEYWGDLGLSQEQMEDVTTRLQGLSLPPVPKRRQKASKKRARVKGASPANENNASSSKSESGGGTNDAMDEDLLENVLEAICANVLIVDDCLCVVAANGRCRDAFESVDSATLEALGVKVRDEEVLGEARGFFADPAAIRRKLKRIGAYGIESDFSAGALQGSVHIGAATVRGKRVFLLTWNSDSSPAKAEVASGQFAVPEKEDTDDGIVIQSAISGSVENLLSVSQRLALGAEETSSQANLVSAASEEVSGNLQTVASGMDELRESISEIARSASQASEVAAKGVDLAETTNRTVAKLGDSSSEIGKVIKVITTIAQQTNLLALNATIEAARAGEAGKGFAVVANEVKDLAKETATASEDISRKVEAIQSGTAGAVSAISEINSIVNQINEIQLNIAAAVEQQTATAGEIGRNIGEAARGSAEITENIVAVATAARSTSEGATDTKRSAEDLNSLATQLAG